MDKNTRTATISALTTSYQLGTALLPSAFFSETKNFADMTIENKGDTTVRIASGFAAPIDALAATLAAGEILTLAVANVAGLNIKTSDAGGDNKLEVIGTPV